MGLKIKNFIHKHWCRIPNCWSYIRYEYNEDAYRVLYFWAFGRKWEVIKWFLD